MGLFGTSIKDAQLREARVKILALIQAAQKDINGLEKMRDQSKPAPKGVLVNVMDTIDTQIAVRKKQLADNITAEVQKLVQN